MTRTGLLVLVLSVAVAGGVAPTASAKETGDAGAEAASGAQAFIRQAAMGGLAEVALGKLAQEKASDPAVKTFGGRMVTDHGKANQELEALAKKENVTLPTQLDAKHEALRDRLAKLSGDAFDEAYMSEMVEDHEKDVAEFRAAATASTDADVKAFAAKTLPVLEGHLKMAKDVRPSL